MSASAADDFVEQPFHHHVPVGDRPVEHVEHRHVAEIGVGAGAEAQLVGMRREPDIDRQHPQLLEHLQDAALGHDRQREDHEIDAGPPRELDQIVDGAELARAGDRLRRAVVAAVVEQADHAHVGIALIADRRRQRLAGGAAADDGGAPRQPAFLGPAPHQHEQRAAERQQRHEPDDIEAAEPDPRELVAGLGEERHADQNEEHHRPGRGEPEILLLMAAERLHLVDVGDLERQHGQHRDAGDGAEILPLHAVLRHHVADIDQHADQRDQRESRSCGRRRPARSATAPAPPARPRPSRRLRRGDAVRLASRSPPRPRPRSCCVRRIAPSFQCPSRRACCRLRHEFSGEK